MQTILRTDYNLIRSQYEHMRTVDFLRIYDAHSITIFT